MNHPTNPTHPTHPAPLASRDNRKELITFLAPPGTREAIATTKAKCGVDEDRIMLLGMIIHQRRADIEAAEHEALKAAEAWRRKPWHERAILRIKAFFNQLRRRFMPFDPPDSPDFPDFPENTKQ